MVHLHVLLQVFWTEFVLSLLWFLGEDGHHVQSYHVVTGHAETHAVNIVLDGAIWETPTRDMIESCGSGIS